MDVLALDLAARNSAYCLLQGGQVALQAVSTGRDWALPGWQFVREAAAAAGLARVPLVVEDLPMVPRFDSGVRDVVRLQGALVVWAGQAGLEDVIFIKPALWQRATPGVWRQGVTGARRVAAELGYTPPDLVGTWDLPAHGAERQRVRSLAKKLETDFVDAFLIAHWAQTADLVTPSTLIDRVTCETSVVRPPSVYGKALA